MKLKTPLMMMKMILLLIHKILHFSKPSKGYTVKQLFEIIFSTVQLLDLTADDNGIWRVSMPRKVTLVDDAVIDVTEVRDPADDEENVFTVTRQYGTHAGTPEFYRIITTIASRQMGRVRYAVLQYFFSRGEREYLSYYPIMGILTMKHHT